MRIAMLGLLSIATTTSYRAPAAQLQLRRAAIISARRGFAQLNGGGRASAAVVQAEKAADGAAADGEPSGPKGAMDLNPPRGTRDFYPEDMALRNWLFGRWRQVATSHGFEEYDAPVLETEDLYIRKAGEDVTQQLYSLQDRSGRRLSLRPEMTPSLARMVLGRKGALAMPLKWFSIPQCWRYERMTRGRRREHYQWNLDVWGVDTLTAEVELLSAAVSFCKSVGLTSADVRAPHSHAHARSLFPSSLSASLTRNVLLCAHSQVGIKLSTRLVLSELLTSLGVPEDKFASTCVLVDKLDKLPEDEVRSALLEQGLPADSAETLLSTLAITDFGALEKAMGGESKAVKELKELFTLAEAYGIADWLVLDLSVVRGLAYYTGTVFEGFDRSGELRAIFGGGRYDKLLSTFGGDDLSAAGFGFGDAVIVELLKAKGLLPELKSDARKVLIACQDEALRPKAMAAATAIREAGGQVDMVLEPKKPKWVFKHADRTGVGYVVLFAPREAEEGLVRVKCMADGEQADVPMDGMADWYVKAVPAA